MACCRAKRAVTAVASTVLVLTVTAFAVSRSGGQASLLLRLGSAATPRRGENPNLQSATQELGAIESLHSAGRLVSLAGEPVTQELSLTGDGEKQPAATALAQHPRWSWTLLLQRPHPRASANTCKRGASMQKRVMPPGLPARLQASASRLTWSSPTRHIRPWWSSLQGAAARPGTWRNRRWPGSGLGGREGGGACTHACACVLCFRAELIGFGCIWPTYGWLCAASALCAHQATTTTHTARVNCVSVNISPLPDSPTGVPPAPPHAANGRRAEGQAFVTAAPAVPTSAKLTCSDGRVVVLSSAPAPALGTATGDPRSTAAATAVSPDAVADPAAQLLPLELINGAATSLENVLGRRLFPITVATFDRQAMQRADGKG